MANATGTKSSIFIPEESVEQLARSQIDVRLYLAVHSQWLTSDSFSLNPRSAVLIWCLMSFSALSTALRSTYECEIDPDPVPCLNDC